MLTLIIKKAWVAIFILIKDSWKQGRSQSFKITILNVHLKIPKELRNTQSKKLLKLIKEEIDKSTQNWRVHDPLFGNWPN